MADPYAGYIGNGIEGAWLKLTQVYVQIAGTWLRRHFNDLSVVLLF
jgi:hypothetical protein